MAGIFGVLYTGKEALFTQQKAVDVTGHNIANANTPGYSRQRVNMETREPVDARPGQMGTGVRAAEIQRIHDKFLGIQITNENQDLGRWEAQKSGVERLEMIFNESMGFGINEALSEFWNSWHDLVNDPSGEAERTVVAERGAILGEIFQNKNKELQSLQKEIDRAIDGVVTNINEIAAQIADLNHKIYAAEARGQNANDFRDKRELLLKDLSSNVDVQTFENGDGNVTVLLRNGRTIVENDRATELSTEPNGTGLHDVFWNDNDGNSVNVTSDINGGALKGWLEVRDVTVPHYIDQMNELAGAIIDEVNTLHQSGYGLEDPATGEPFAGNDFFVGTSAEDIAVTQEILDNPHRIAAAATAGGVPGDNSNAIAIAELKHALTMNNNTATFDEFYSSMVGTIGTDVQEATMFYEHQSTVLDQLNSYRESVSGVSLDEEMVNLIKFQHAYDAAAKLITTVDEMLVTLLSMR
jgi:flagellar hook-associated protein 1 FlgK